MSTKVKTKDELVLKTEDIKLSQTDIKDIEQSFKESKDFRSIGEKITSPIDDIISETSKVIDNDPIMNVSNELKGMNNDVQSVYNDIIDNDGSIMRFMKKVPLIGGLARTLDEKFDEASFNIKGVEGKINVIFSGFDTTYESINKSIDMQMDFLDGLEGNLGKVEAYKNYIEIKIEEFNEKMETTDDPEVKNKMEMFIRNVEFFKGNLVVLLGNLEMAKKRLNMRLESANKLALSMSSSRPIFKTLLSTAIIETSGQKAIDASIKAIDIMGSTIDKMSSDLTDKAIEGSKRSEEIASKPVLSSSVFIENVTKLKNHFEEIEDFRAKIQIEAGKERKEFEIAKNKLDEMKVLNKKDTEEFNKEIL